MVSGGSVHGLLAGTVWQKGMEKEGCLVHGGWEGQGPDTESEVSIS